MELISGGGGKRSTIDSICVSTLVVTVGICYFVVIDVVVLLMPLHVHSVYVPSGCKHVLCCLQRGEWRIVQFHDGLLKSTIKMVLTMLFRTPSDPICVFIYNCAIKSFFSKLSFPCLLPACILVAIPFCSLHVCIVCFLILFDGPFASSTNPFYSLGTHSSAN